MNKFTNEERKEAIVKNYEQVALQNSCCGNDTNGCGNNSLNFGYSKQQLQSIPSDSDKGLGCGNPTIIASLKKGETVLDLGSGAGLDCFLSSKEVGETGNVIGVDMTMQMIVKSRENKTKNNYDNVDFRLGEIENLPVSNDSIDVIISNCVINLSLNKQQVFNEAYRVLKNGGRLAISDIVLTKEIPEKQITLDNFGSCIAGASYVNTLENLLINAGFKDIEITKKGESKKFLKDWDDNIENFIVSADIKAVKLV